MSAELVSLKRPKAGPSPGDPAERGSAALREGAGAPLPVGATVQGADGNAAGSSILAAAPGPAVWIGRVMSGVVVVFLVFDGAIKVLELPVVEETLAGLGYPAGLARGLGVLTLAIAVLYAVPRTAVLGAVLLTGLLGGAMATHLRAGSPIFTHLLFGLYLGWLAWGGLVLRDPATRALLGLRRAGPPSTRPGRET